MSQQTIVDIVRQLERARSHYGIALLSGSVDAKQANKIISELSKQAERFASLVTPGPTEHYPTLAERIAQLVIAMEKVANQHGAVSVPRDTLQELVVAACPTSNAAEFWRKGQPESLLGMVLHAPALAAELRTRGVLAWADANDGLTRLVNTAWLATHGQIYRFVIGEKPPGQRCRFCRLHEPDGSKLRDHVAGTETVQLHDQCRPFWLEWAGIAGKYQSAETADAADVEAGRTEGPPPALPAAFVTPEPPPFFGKEKQ